MAGQASHFINYAPEGNDYSKSRYLNEYDRLLGVMNFQLGKTAYLAGDHYTIADMACFPWILPYKRYGFDLGEFEHLKRWFDELKQRPLLRKGVDMGKDWRPDNGPDDKARAILFNQTSAIYKDK
jgi:GST-like protein